MPSQKKSSTKKAKGVSKSSRSGLVFPVSRVGGSLRKGRYAKRVSTPAAVFLTAVMEYCTKELLTLSAKTAHKNKKQHNIKPRHICLAVREDEDLSQLLSQVTISGGGVMGGVHGAMLKKKKEPSGEKKEKKKGDKKKKEKKTKKASPTKSPKKSPKKTE
eukprot:TRINITY_DN297_c0_g1_i1.p2 TRINITY_DN297_c0_g1~~TRINITY_DN297_c0_g1_i1.p2  ORF type:complete len:160 (+),score=97.49 TRINITY_DN297_c0_g1_i1:88-567(+)